MKRVIFLFIIITVCSCTKENVTPSIVGNWNIIERKIGTGAGFQTSPITTQRTLFFKSDGTFHITDADTTGILHDFNRYTVLQNQRIQFYSTNLTDMVVIDFNLNDNLLLSYPARCGFQELFSRQ